MGGRGSSSASGRSRFGIPGDARAMTITYSDGRRVTYFQNESGMLMSATDIGTTVGTPVMSSNVDIATMYQRATDRGYDVELLSSDQVERNNDAYRQRRAENQRDIARAETSGTSQSRRISRNSGRINSRRTRGR